MRRVTMILGLVTTISLLAKQPIINTVGTTYEFAEKDMLSAIHNYIDDNEDKIKKRLDKERTKMKGVIKNFKPKNLAEITTAREDKIFYPNMEYTLDMDIKDGDGNIMYPKGFKFNPLDYVKLNISYVVINAAKREEVNWFKNSDYYRNANYALLITDGSYYLISKEIKQVVQFATKEFTDRFKIEKTPSVVAQFNNKIQIKEIGVKNDESNTAKNIK